MSLLQYKERLIRSQIALAATLVLSFAVCPGQSGQSAPSSLLPPGFKLVEPGEPDLPLTELRAKAESGDAKAQNELGFKYLLGKGVPKDTAEGVRWLRRAAEQGDTNAANNLGWIYLKGQGIAKDPSEALKWFVLGAEDGDAKSQKELGEIYQKGWGVPQDLAESLKWFGRAAEQIPEQPDHSARNSLNRIFIEEARHELGEIYSQGEGVERDDTQAVKWFKKAADLGDADAQWEVGFAYDRGQGLPQDKDLAESWYRRAAASYQNEAERGEAASQSRLAAMYQAGEGVPRDAAKAEEWYGKAAASYGKAAEKGSVHAQHSLGDIYNNGIGVPKDHAQAAFWFRKAAEQGDDGAQYALGRMYYDGLGVPQDFVQAATWYEKAAQQGNEAAQYSLSRMQTLLISMEENQRKQRDCILTAVIGTGFAACVTFVVMRHRRKVLGYSKKAIPRTKRAKQLTVLLVVASWCSACCLYQALDPLLMRHPINAAVTALLFSIPVLICGSVSLWWISAPKE
jgi:TPR repeat protein